MATQKNVASSTYKQTSLEVFYILSLFDKRFCGKGWTDGHIDTSWGGDVRYMVLRYDSIKASNTALRGFSGIVTSVKRKFTYDTLRKILLSINKLYFLLKKCMCIQKQVSIFQVIPTNEKLILLKNNYTGQWPSKSML